MVLPTVIHYKPSVFMRKDILVQTHTMFARIHYRLTETDSFKKLGASNERLRIVKKWKKCGRQEQEELL